MEGVVHLVLLVLGRSARGGPATSETGQAPQCREPRHLAGAPWSAASDRTEGGYVPTARMASPTLSRYSRLASAALASWNRKRTACPRRRRMVAAAVCLVPTSMI